MGQRILYTPLRIATVTSSSISLIANLIILITCHRHEKIGKTFSRQLIYYQTLADLLGNLAYIFLSPDQKIQCNFFGVIVFTMNLSSVLWTVVMSFVLQMVTDINKIPIFPANQYFTFYHIFCWVFPALLSLLPYAHGRLFLRQCTLLFTLLAGGYDSVSSAWCFISDGTMRIIIFYSPVWISIIYIMISTVITTTQVPPTSLPSPPLPPLTSS
jgi:hypothetical protein